MKQASMIDRGGIHHKTDFLLGSERQKTLRTVRVCKCREREREREREKERERERERKEREREGGLKLCVKREREGYDNRI